MELGREEGFAAVADSFVGVIVHVDEEGFPVGRKGSGVHCESMVLGSDEALVGADAAHGLVVASVAVFEFIDLRPGGLGEELIAHADAADGASDFDCAAEYLDCAVGHRGVAGAVRDKHAVVVHIGVVIVPWNADNAHTAARKAAHDVVFYATVDQDNGFVAFAVLGHFATRCFSDEVFGIGVVPVDGVGVGVTDNDFAEHRATFAQMFCQCSGVDAVYAGNFFLAQPLVEAAFALPVAVVPRVILNNQTTAMDVVAFKVLAQFVTIAVSGVIALGHSVVSLQGEGGDEYLALVRWVSETFGISGHSGVKHNFAGSIAVITEGLTFEHSAVAQNEAGFRSDTHWLVGFWVM